MRPDLVTLFETIVCFAVAIAATLVARLASSKAWVAELTGWTATVLYGVSLIGDGGGSAKALDWMTLSLFLPPSIVAVLNRDRGNPYAVGCRRVGWLTLGCVAGSAVAITFVDLPSLILPLILPLGLNFAMYPRKSGWQPMHALSVRASEFARKLGLPQVEVSVYVVSDDLSLLSGYVENAQRMRVTTAAVEKLDNEEMDCHLVRLLLDYKARLESGVSETRENFFAFIFASWLIAAAFLAAKDWVLSALLLLALAIVVTPALVLKKRQRDARERELDLAAVALTGNVEAMKSYLQKLGSAGNAKRRLANLSQMAELPHAAGMNLSHIP